MGWVTVYIRGKSGFKSEVQDNLDSSGIRFMPGFANERGVALYWIDETDELRAFKKAIGSKTVFKYRLRFFTTIEEFVETRHNAKPEHMEFS
jgi:hypothetical protein